MLVVAEGDDEGAGVGGEDDVDDEGEGGADDAAATAVDPSALCRSNGRPGRAKPVGMELVDAEDDGDEGADVDGEDEAGDGDERGTVGAIGSASLAAVGVFLTEH